MHREREGGREPICIRWYILLLAEEIWIWDWEVGRRREEGGGLIGLMWSGWGDSWCFLCTSKQMELTHHEMIESWNKNRLDSWIIRQKKNPCWINHNLYWILKTNVLYIERKKIFIFIRLMINGNNPEWSVLCHVLSSCVCVLPPEWERGRPALGLGHLPCYLQSRGILYYIILIKKMP